MVDALRQLAAEKGATASQLAIAWVLANAVRSDAFNRAIVMLQSDLMMFGVAVGTMAGRRVHRRNPEQRVRRTPPDDAGSKGDGANHEERDAERVQRQHPSGDHENNAGQHSHGAI
jgi:hypothetical protein